MNKNSVLINHQRGLAGDTDFRDFSQDRGGDGGMAGVLDGGAGGDAEFMIPQSLGGKDWGIQGGAAITCPCCERNDSNKPNLSKIEQYGKNINF